MLRALLAAGAGAGAGAVGLELLHRHRDWGATPQEAAAVLPGDELVPDPAVRTTLGVTVRAPAAGVWAWLVQMGQDRGGMYSYDWLENAVGLDIHTTGEVREEWQHLTVGDRVVVVPEGWGPLPDGYSFRVARVEPPRVLVLRQAPPEHPWNGVWSFHVADAGEGRCRLLARSRTEASASAVVRLAGRVLEPVTLVMTRRMLHGIRQHAEDRAGAASAGAASR
ncbi:hypothetical protein GCM10027451_51830 [Geodermatophilus aquaeductus]|uniref:Polyketide cyclase / dehydrase and lipid transport n=1 Tax=Geodermatophilus aquaeductus TaxID=1564161 RepID=A0A521FW35_9ACTN|nr:SRPBCC family protein [Geodermatophilus aquaeductus]SMP00090.1 hypothetical protein SAMN06273567_12327 [Geodermatophilus aquaeductus]